jgi:radical SAM superfamily enzyme YgiQ (UPF0313 family)
LLPIVRMNAGTRRTLLLVMPDAGIHRLRLGPVSVSFREAPLTLTTLAALVSDGLELDITLIDESVQQIPFGRHFDLVGISCLTGTALRAYSIADRFRSSGSTIILGGVHVTLRPEEASRHADAVVVGPAERTWPKLLADWSDGRLGSRYEDDGGAVNGMPHPRRDLQNNRAYLTPNSVFASRGCKRSCDFCTVAALGFSWQSRPVADVIDEIRAIPSRRFVFNDVSLTEDRDYALELFSALVPLRRKWGGLAPVELAEDPELLDLMQESGCIFLLTGFESLDHRGLRGISKGFNIGIDYRQAVEAFHDRGITVQGCFIFGLDHDDGTVFDSTVDAVNELKIDIPRFAVFTPYPETRAFKRLKAEGRILHEYWPHYDTQHVVFEPARMSPGELDRGFRNAYRRAFSARAMSSRVLCSPHPLVTLAGNAAYRLYLRRLHHSIDRLDIAKPVRRPCPK